MFLRIYFQHLEYGDVMCVCVCEEDSWGAP